MHRLTYANVVATLALITAVAGGTTAIAVSKSTSKSDVNKKGNIRAGRVTTPKLADGAVTASKLAGVDAVQATAGESTIATCPSGEQLVGGGGEVLSSAGVALAVSRPLGNGWYVVQSGGLGPREVAAYALCARN